MVKKSLELKQWEKALEYIGNERITLGPQATDDFRNNPRRLLFSLSHCKFAAKIIGEAKEVLEVGCGEGIGTVLLAEFAKKVVGIDIDERAVADATRCFASDKIKFLNVDFLGANIGKFDSVVSFDVVEHIFLENEERFFDSIVQNLKKEGICIVGTPNKTSASYATESSRIGHVNYYTWDRLRDTMHRYFKQVFILSSNDEMIHTGFYPMAQYLIGIGVGKK